MSQYQVIVVDFRAPCDEKVFQVRAGNWRVAVARALRASGIRSVLGEIFLKINVQRKGGT